MPRYPILCIALGRTWLRADWLTLTALIEVCKDEIVLRSCLPTRHSTPTPVVLSTYTRALSGTELRRFEPRGNLFTTDCLMKSEQKRPGEAFRCHGYLYLVFGKWMYGVGL